MLPPRQPTGVGPPLRKFFRAAGWSKGSLMFATHYNRAISAQSDHGFTKAVLKIDLLPIFNCCYLYSEGNSYNYYCYRSIPTLPEL